MANLIWKKIQSLMSDSQSDNPIIQLDITECSPIPSEMAKMPMGGEFKATQVIEHISRNLLKQRLELQCSTWCSIKEIYEAAKVDPDAQILLDILFVTSKVDVDEYCKYYKKEIKSLLVKRDVILANQRIMNEIKQFLLRRPVMTAFEEGLAKLGLESDVVKIRNFINDMQIYFSKSLGDQIQGIALRNGILISIFWYQYIEAFGYDLEATVNKCLLNADAMKLKAWVITKCCHETAHFLARSFSNDFNFSSPNFCTDKDPHDDTKSFELGRYIELRLFEMQPNWNKSSERAATDFINNALFGNELPLIRRNENNFAYLLERDKPSLSFAADIEWIDFDGCVG